MDESRIRKTRLKYLPAAQADIKDAAFLITKVATSKMQSSTLPTETMLPGSCDQQQSWSSTCWSSASDGDHNATPTTSNTTTSAKHSNASPSQPHPPPLSTSLLCTSLSTVFTISLTVLLVVVLGTSLCSANGENDSRFALRPFLHQASPPQPLSRRQEVLSFDHLDSPVARLPPPPPEPALVPINLAPVPRGGSSIISGPSSAGGGHSSSSSSSSAHKPSFQRIRLTKPSNSQSSARLQQNLPPPPLPITPAISAPSGFTPIHFSTSPNESPLSNFQRIAGFNGNGQPQSSANSLHPQPLSIIAPSADLSQRQSFRRVKPSSSSSSSSITGARRVKVKTASPSLPASPVSVPIQLAPSRVATPFEINSRRVVQPTASLAPLQPQRLRGRGPVNGGANSLVSGGGNDDDFFHKDNALDNEDGDGGLFGNRVNSDSSSSGGDDGIQFIGTLSRPPTLSSTAAAHHPKPTSSHHHHRHKSTASVHTPTIPLTYYTTYTYFTTVLRGHHTATLSRELVSSTTAIKPIDRSIVTAIEFSEGYIQPSKTGLVQLGTKTKGQTTTIYNVASRVQVFNDDLYKVIYATRGPTPASSKVDSIEPTRITSSHLSSAVPSSSIKIEPTRVHSRPLASSSAQPQSQSRTPISPTKLEELDRLPKKLLTKYTYFYTFIDGFNTRYSTRMEESTAPFTGQLATLMPALDSSIDAEGNLQLLSPKSATVALGSRAHGHMTTVVNLALNNYISFDIVRDVRIKPTSVLSSAGPEVKPTPSPSLTPSFADQSEVVSSSRVVNHFNSPDLPEAPDSSSSAVVKTPRLSSEVTISSSSISSSSSSKILVSSSSSVRGRPGSSRRPVRVKVKPIRSKLATLSRVASSRVAASSSQLLEIVSSSGGFSSGDIFSSQTLAISPSPSSELPHPVSSTSRPELSSSIDSSSSAPSSRKKVAFTIRRPSVSGSNRYFHRRPSSYLVRSSSTLLSSPVGPESTSLPELLLSPSASNSVDSSSSSSMPPVSYIPSTNLLSASMDTSFLLTPVLKPSKASKSRLVVLTRLAGNLNRWNPLYAASRIRVSSRKVLKSTITSSGLSSSMMSIEPTSTVETIFETTTHTVPFTLGSTTIYTTVEETNSRVVTRSEMDDMSSSSSVDLLSPSFEPEVMSSTAVKATESATLASSPPPSTVTFETRTSLTTLTHFNTIYKGDTSEVTSSEQTLSSLFSIAKFAPVSSTVVTETIDAFTTSTLYSTYTYFATLFNGTQTRITPLEEIKTEYLTLREPVTITRTIIPSAPPASIRATSTIKGDMPSSSVAVASSGVLHLEGSFATTETISTHTTLTHFITLFSGTRTILSSIEEISPTVMTRTRTLVQSTSTMETGSSSSSSSMPTSTTTESDLTTRLSPSIVEMASGPMMSSSSTSSTPSSTSRTATISSRRKSLMSPTRKLETSSSSVLFNKDQIDKDVGSAMPTAILIGPSTTLVNEQQSSSSTAVLKPGSVIELNDLLQGVNNAGQIGETIKDIVNNIVTRPDMPADDDPTTTTTTSSTNGDETTISTTTTDPTTDGPLTTSLPDGGISTLAPSFSSSSNSRTPSLSKHRADAKFPVYIPNQTNLPKYYMSTSEEKVIFSTQTEEGDGEQQPPVSTRYVTSVEKAAKTLTLTSTKVYYTRDAPLTITSIHTTTLPPITYVSTIIGSKTILGTYNSITPTKSSTMIDTASATSSVATSSSATTSAMPAPTTRPRLHRPKNQEQQQQPPLLKAKVTPFLSSQPKNKGSQKNGNKAATLPPSIFMNTSLEAADLCSPACNATNKEYCKVEEAATSASPGKYTCECRPGYVRRPSDGSCQEIKNYLVVVRVSKTAESEVAAHHTGNEVQSFTRVARRLTTSNGGRGLDASTGIADLQVLSVERSSRSQAATMVNLTIQLDPSVNRNVQDDLSRKLSSLGQVEKVVDFDECTSPVHNDCSPRARCINEPGTYRCQCLESFIDLDAVSPGRHCVSEVKSCDYCYGRGDCWRSQANTVCRCHPMFIGRRCEINGLLLAILVPIIAILVIVAIIAFLYCSRKLRQRNRRLPALKNLAAYGPVAVIGGTLDRKAMLETSSESSDPQHRSSHYNSESNPASARGSMARRNGTGGGNGSGNGHGAITNGQDTVGRRPSEPSLDRSLGTYSATGSAYNSMPPQILIPRARPPYTIHPGQVYMW